MDGLTGVFEGKIATPVCYFSMQRCFHVRHIDLSPTNVWPAFRLTTPFG